MKARVATYLRLTAFRKGVAGSNRFWFALWTGMALARFVRRRLAREETVVERVVLGPGQAIEIRDTGIERAAFEA